MHTRLTLQINEHMQRMSTSFSRMIFFQNYFKLKAQIKEIKDIIVSV